MNWIGVRGRSAAGPCRAGWQTVPDCVICTMARASLWPSRAEPSRTRDEPSRGQPSRAEPSQLRPAELSRAEASRAEPSRAELSGAEASRAEPSRASQAGSLPLLAHWGVAILHLGVFFRSRNVKIIFSIRHHRWARWYPERCNGGVGRVRGPFLRALGRTPPPPSLTGPLGNGHFAR